MGTKVKQQPSYLTNPNRDRFTRHTAQDSAMWSLLELHVTLVASAESSSGQWRLQVYACVLRSACSPEEDPESGQELRQDAAVDAGARISERSWEASEVRAGGRWSGGQNQPGRELHHQWLSHRVRADCVWQLLRWRPLNNNWNSPLSIKLPNVWLNKHCNLEYHNSMQNNHHIVLLEIFSS